MKQHVPLEAGKAFEGHAVEEVVCFFIVLRVLLFLLHPASVHPAAFFPDVLERAVAQVGVHLVACHGDEVGMGVDAFFAAQLGGEGDVGQLGSAVL